MMKTLTIKREMIKSLESDKSKVEFANSVIALFTDREAVRGGISERLQNGLNVDLPEPVQGAPEFDSKNMAAAEFRRFSMVRAGYFPVHLNCSYGDYTYKHRDDFSDEELADMFVNVGSKIWQSKGKKGFIVFLKYIQDVLLWFRNHPRKMKVSTE